MFTSHEILEMCHAVGVTHAIWLPDSTLGQWDAALSASRKLRLVRVCREGEAWPLAAGLYLAGQQPLIFMQSTGFFESGDALRNTLFDLQIPVLALIGIRNWLHPDSPDSARRFALPLVDSWGLDPFLLEPDQPIRDLERYFQQSSASGRLGIALMPEAAG